MKKIIYIMSSNFSGSHFLSLMLGSHSRFQHIGEIKWLRKINTDSARSLCGFCQGHARCPVLSGLSPENVENVYELIFSNVGPDIDGLIDTSKKIFWAEKFLTDQRYEKKFIHLVRDPRALVRRWLLDENRSIFRERFKLVKHSGRNLKKALLGDSLDIYVGKWLKQNQTIIDFIAKNQLDVYNVTYHDLVKHEEQTLSNLMEWMGCSYEEGQADYWNFIHHGSTKSEYEWVNQKKIKHFDCRWKEFLSKDQKQRIVSNDGVKNLLQHLGVAMVDDGLTKYE
ncbi:sulfotransferase [Deltaproteobacteria bacterium IMCC39524]|nr:sulfotransferase [Deltaproteobacteria bacterium IMCC39524]